MKIDIDSLASAIAIAYRSERDGTEPMDPVIAIDPRDGVALYGSRHSTPDSWYVAYDLSCGSVDDIWGSDGNELTSLTDDDCERLGWMLSEFWHDADKQDEFDAFCEEADA